MPKLPRPSGKEMLAFLLARGFVVVRIHGSHHVLEREELRTVVPVHANDALKIGTLHGILRDVKLTATEFSELWNE